MKCRILIFVLLILLFFIFPKKTFAASIISNSSQVDISYTQEFIVNSTLSIQSQDGTSYFLRGVFYKEGTSNYCGITWNGSEWFAGPYSTSEGWKKFLKITTTNNSWQGELKAKIDQDDSGCKESGVYKFKIQRFNEGSGSSNFDDQNELSVSIVVPTATPTPTPTSKPTPTTKPTATSKPNPTVKFSPSPILDPGSEAEVLGFSDEEFQEDFEDSDSESHPNDLLNIATKAAQSSPILKNDFDSSSLIESDGRKNSIFTFGGLLSLLASCGILVMRKLRGA